MFFIVISYVLMSGVWDMIRGISTKDNKLGRVLITTHHNHNDVAGVTCTDNLHCLRFLNPGESWKLLHYECMEIFML